MADNANGNSKVMDERIVAAKFDSSQFEKGVDKTIGKLDELKKSLNLEKTGESLAEVSKKAKEAQESSAKSLEKLSERYTTFTGMIKQKLLSGLADQVVDVFFRMEKAAIGFAKSMTFDQISVGMKKYEDAMTSVRMIVNSYRTVKNEITGVTEKIHYTQDEAYRSISNLQTYADETSYSMSQMTDAMSKMVAAGVDLEQAEKNVQGIANACAAAGVNATDASRAFYNLAQAYSSGALKYTDYRSLQLLNMTNQNFEEALVEAGVKMGTLEAKTDKNGNTVYKTKKSKSNSKVTAGKTFSQSQVSDALKYGWAGTDVMDYLFGSGFYVDIEDFYAARDYQERLTDQTDEAILELKKARTDYIKSLDGLDPKEREAALKKYDEETAALKNDKTTARKKYLQELKDFDAIEKYVKELADTSQTKQDFKALGDDEDAKKEYLQQLSNQADMINKVSKKYGEIQDEDLKKYLSGLDDTDSRKQTYKDLKTEAERKKYLQELKKDADIQQNVKGKDLGVDTEALEKYIMSLEKESDYYAIRQKYEAMSEAQKKQYLKDLAKESEALGKISRKYSDTAIEALLAGREARNLKDVISSIGDYVSSKWTKVFENLIGQLDKASDFFTDLTEGGIASLFTEFAGWIADVSDAFNMGGVGSQEFRDSILSLDGAIGNIFGIFNDLLPDSSELGYNLMLIMGEISVGLQNFENWTDKFRAWFNEAERADRITKIFANLSGIFTIFGKVVGIAFGTVGKVFETVAPIVDEVITALGKITDPIGELGALDNNGPFEKLSQGIDNVFRAIEPLVKILTESEEGGTSVLGFIGNVIGIVGNFVVSGIIDTAVANITFFADAIGLLLELFGQKSAQEADGKGVLQGIQEDIQSLADTCSKALGTISGFFSAVIKDLRKLFGLTVEEDSAGEDGGIFGNVKNWFDTNEFIPQLEEWFANAKTNITNWFTNIPTRISNWLNNIFYTTESTATLENGQLNMTYAVVETPFKKWIDGIIPSLTNWFEQAKTDIITWVSEVPGKISTFFTSLLYREERTATLENGQLNMTYAVVETPLKQWLDGAVQTVSDFIGNIPGYILAGIGKVGDIFDTIIDALFGTEDKSKDKKSTTPDAGTAAKGWGETFLNGIWTAISSIPSKVGEFITQIKDRFKKNLDKIKEWFNNSETKKKVTEFGTQIITAIKNFIINLPETIKNVIKGVGSIGRTIINAIKSAIGLGNMGETVQNDIENQVKEISITGILRSIGEIGTTIFNQVMSWFTGTEEFELNAQSFAIAVGAAIGAIPGLIWVTVRKIGTDLGEIWNYIVRKLTSDDATEGTDAQTPDEFAQKHPIIAKIINAAVEWIKGIPQRLNEAIAQAQKDIQTLFSGISTIWNNAEEIARIDKLLEDTNLSEQSRKMWLQRRYELTGSSNFEATHPGLSSAIISIKTWISDIPETLTSLWSDVSKQVTDFWDDFKDFWKTLGTEGESSDGEQELTNFEKNHPMISGWIRAARTWIVNIPNSLSNWWALKKKEVVDFWEQFKVFWNSYGNEEGENKTPTQFETEHPLIAGWVTSARGWIESIPETLATAFEAAKAGIATLFNGISAFWNNAEDIDQINKRLDESIEGSGEWTALMKQKRDLTGSSDFEKNHPLLASAIISMRTWLDNLPTKIDGAWTTATESLTNFWNKLVAAFNGDNLEQDKDLNSQTLGQRMQTRITGFFAELPSYITTGIGAALTAINAAFTGLTGLLSGANAEEFKDNLNDTAETIGSTLAETGEKVGEETPAQKFRDGIAKIGEAFWNIITVTIPDFIKAGFNYVGTHWEEWKTSLLGIFGNIPLLKPGEFDMEKIKESIKQAILDLPNTIESAWNTLTGAVGNLFGTNKKPITQEMMNYLMTDNISQDDKNKYKKQWEEQGYDLSRTVNDPSLWESFLKTGETIGQYITEGITFAVNNIGPIIVTAWNNTLELIGKIFDGLTSWFNNGSDEEKIGDELTSPFGDTIEPKFKESVNSLGANIIAFAKKIPGFLGAGLAHVVHSIPEVLGSFLEAFSKTWDELEEGVEETVTDGNESTSPEQAIEQKKGKFTEILQSIATKLEGVFNSVLGFLFNDKGQLTFGGRVLIFLAGFILILSTITNLINAFDHTDKTARKYEAKNSVEGVITKILNTMMVAMIVASYAAKLNETEFQRFNDVLDMMSGWINRVLTIYEIFKGLTMAKDVGMSIFDTFFKKDDDDDDAEDAVEDAVEEVSRGEQLLNLGMNLVGKAEGALEGVVGAAGAGAAIEIVGNSISDVITEFTANFAEVGAALSTFATELEKSIETINTIDNNIGTTINVIGKVLDLIGQITKINNKTNEITSAMKTLRQLRLGIGGFSTVFKGNFHTEEIIQAIRDLMGMTGDMTTFAEFVQTGDTYNVFKEAIASLGSALSFYKDANLENGLSMSDKGIQNAVTILEGILKNDGLIELAENFISTNLSSETENMYESVERLIMFASGLTRLGNAFSGFNSDASTGLIGFVEAVQGLAISDAVAEANAEDALEGAGLVSFSEKMGALGDGLTAFGNAIGDFEDKDVRNAQHALDMVADLGTRLNDVGNGALKKFFDGGTSISEFALQLSTLGYNMQLFMEYMHPIVDEEGNYTDWNFDYIYSATYAIKQVLSSVSGLNYGGGIKELGNFLDNGEKHAAGLVQFLATVGSFQITHPLIDINELRDTMSAFEIFGQAINHIAQYESSLHGTFSALMGYSNYADMGGFTEVVTKIMDAFDIVSERMRKKTQFKDANGTISYIKKIDIDSVRSAFGLIRQLFDSLAATTHMYTNFDYVMSGEEVMKAAFDAMKVLIDNPTTLTQFLDTLSGYRDAEKLQRAKETMSVLADLGTVFATFKGLSGGLYIGAVEGENIKQNIDRILDALTAYMTDPEKETRFIEMGATVAPMILKGIEQALNNNDETSFNPEIKIRPVLDEESVTTLRSDLSSLFGVENTVDFNLGAGFAAAVQQAFGGSETFVSINTAVSSMDEKLSRLDPIESHLISLQGEMAAVKDAFRSMGVYLDKGVIVGELAPAITAHQNWQNTLWGGRVATGWELMGE